MLVTALDGRAVDVRRQWVRWSSNGPTVLGVDKVRGWRDSSERIREIGAAYERGEDPFSA